MKRRHWRYFNGRVSVLVEPRTFAVGAIVRRTKIHVHLGPVCVTYARARLRRALVELSRLGQEQGS